MYNSQYYTCEQIDERLLQGYLDDYNTQTGQSLTKAQFLTKLGNIFSKEGVINNIATQVGYYECDTAAGTAAKAITVANYALFAGGSMKVKFVNENTANNATLNINSQGDKALYYQGERASATNSWDANEVVEIYYDGTSYYANNVKGGSGSGVYDVSKEHPTSGPNSDGKFTLEYILNSSNVNELIPVNKRYPGMSIQFVSTSDNKYVQFRYMETDATTNSKFTNVANWQGFDDEPKAESPNAVKSSGIIKGILEDGGSYDVSAHFPTDGENGGNTYTLYNAIRKVPGSIREYVRGVKFIDAETNIYVYYYYLRNNLPYNYTHYQFLYNWRKSDEYNGLNLFLSSKENGIWSNNTEVGQVATLSKYTSTAYRHLILNIGEGVEFEINSEGNSNRPAILFLDKDNKILTGSVFSVNTYNYATGKITTPIGCVKMVVNWILTVLTNPYLYLNVIDYVKYNCNIAELILNNNNKILAVSNSHYIRIPTPFTICAGQEIVNVADNQDHYVELIKEGSSKIGIVCYDVAQGKLRMVGTDVLTTTNLVLFTFNETTKKLSLPSEMWLYDNKRPDEDIEFSYLVGSSLFDDVNISAQGTSLKIVFPEKKLRLYDKYGAAVVANTSGLTFTVNSLQALVVAKSTLDVSVINITAVTEEHIVLFRYGLSSMDGLLSSFLLKHIEKAGFVDYTDFIKEANGITVGSAIGDTASMTIYTSNAYKHIVFKAKQGTEIYYKAVGNSTRCPIAFVNENTKEILTGTVVGSNNLQAMGIYTAPADCLVVLNVLVAYNYQLLIKTIDNELFDKYVIAKALGYEDSVNVFSDNHYIRYSDLALVEQSDRKVYGVYQLSKGNKIVTKAIGNRYNCIFAECNADGSVIKNVIGTGFLKNTIPNVYEYVADHDCYILLSPSSDIEYIHVYRSYEPIDIKLDFVGENLKKEREKLEAIRTNSDLTLAHFSDIHNDGASVDGIMALLDKDNFVDDVIHTGDSVSGRFSEGIPSLSSAYNWNKILNVVGNHDGSVEQGGTTVWNGIPVKDVYDLLFAPYVSNWGVTQPTDAATNGYCYYYKDYSEKIRLIVLNESYWDATQKTWFESVLADAKTNNLAVVAIKHSKLNDMTEIDCNFNNKINPSAGMFAVDEARSAVDGFISSGGTFLCWLAGHGHRDNMLKYVNNNRLQLVILVTAAGDVSSDIVKKKSTDYGTAFNVVGFDMTRHIIKIGRIGANTDNCMRKCDCMCIDYTTGDVVYSK